MDLNSSELKINTIKKSQPIEIKSYKLFNCNTTKLNTSYDIYDIHQYSNDFPNGNTPPNTNYIKNMCINLLELKK